MSVPKYRVQNADAIRKSLRRVRMLSRFLDSAFRIPIIGKRIGWDGIIGLIPGIGDAASLMLSLGIIREAWKLGLPRTKLLLMLAIVGLDSLVGAVPVLGDVFDVAFKANQKNAEIIIDHLRREGHDVSTAEEIAAMD